MTERSGSASAVKHVVKAASKSAEALAHAADLLGHVNDIIETCADCAKEVETQRTEQVRITSAARVRVEQIQAQREVLLNYLERSFDERRDNFERLFAGLDRALESGDAGVTKSVLDAIVSLAKDSPFEALKDATSAKAALKDKSTVWDF